MIFNWLDFFIYKRGNYSGTDDGRIRIFHDFGVVDYYAGTNKYDWYFESDGTKQPEYSFRFFVHLIIPNRKRDDMGECDWADYLFCTVLLSVDKIESG